MNQILKTVVALDVRLAAGTSTGDSTYWTGLLEGLSTTASEAPLLLCSNTQKPDKIPWSPNWRWLTIPARSSRWWSLVAFPIAARRAGASVIHTQYNLSPLVQTGGVITIHDVSFFIGPQWFNFKDRVLLQRFVPASAKRSRKVITVSETSKAEIERFIPDAKGKVAVTALAAPSWIEPKPLEAARQQVAQRMGIAGRFALTVGTNWARKNQRLAIEAVQALTQIPDLDLYLVGKNLEVPASATRTRTLGYVDRDLLSALYSAADALVFPSLHEGFGLPILEAFKCGCPVVCGMSGALPEVAGGEATLCDDFEVDTWSRGLAIAVSSNLPDLSERRKRRAAQFSWEETARRTLQVYREAATTNHG